LFSKKEDKGFQKSLLVRSDLKEATGESSGILGKGKGACGNGCVRKEGQRKDLIWGGGLEACNTVESIL